MCVVTGWGGLRPALYLGCSFFVFQQTLRGDTHNFIFVDESCFVRPCAYNEILPMLQTDGCHVVLTSSHKSSDTTAKAFINLATVRNEEILVNNVSFVCPNHLTAMLDVNVTALNCVCYLFQQPHHITAGKAYRRIVSAFSTTKAGGATEDADAKSCMLNELGIMPEALGPNSYSERKRLAAECSGEKLCSYTVPVHEYVTTFTKTGWVFSKSIVVYVDPAPTDVGRSFHAMCFVTRAEELSPEAGHPRFHYVILAVEEFETRDVSEDCPDGLYALAQVFMTTCKTLNRIYDDYFTMVYVAPEANSMHVGPFWARCGELLAEEDWVGPTILSTTIASPVKKRRRDAVPSCEHRVGYALGANKVQKIYSFFTTVYNPRTGNTSDLLCAEYVWGWLLRKRAASIPLYIAQKLACLEIRPVINSGTGCTSYKISGKGTNNGEFVQDDLPIAVCMSVCLCAELLSETYDGTLRRLEPRDQHLAPEDYDRAEVGII